MSQFQIVKPFSAYRKKYRSYLLSNDIHSIYMQDFYLDLVFPKWQLLIFNNSIFIPICLKRKYFIKYITIPHFIQFFSIDKMESAADILQYLFEHYRKIDFSINQETGSSKFELVKRDNYVLLIKENEKISASYNNNTKRNIKYASSYGGRIDELSTEEIVCIIKEDRSEYLDAESKILLEQMLKSKQLSIHCYGVRLGTVILSASIWLYYKGRHYYIYGKSTTLGKQQRSMFFLFDAYFHRVAKKGEIIDFEGSMLSGVARFYQGFGAKKEHYYHYQKKLK